MNTRQPENDGPREGGYHVERLDDVSTRLARLEGRMDSFATKEDLSNAKYNVLVAWIGFAIAIIVGAFSIGLRIWGS